MKPTIGKPFPFIKQTGIMECGTTSLAMILKHYGYYNIKSLLAEWAEVTTEGTDMYALSQIAEKFGFKTDGYKLKYEHLSDIKLPCIAHYQGNHFIVVHKVDSKHVWIADPAYGKDKYTRELFLQKWNGVVLVLEPTNIKETQKDVADLIKKEKDKQSTIFKEFYWKIIKPFRKVIYEILLASFILQVLALALPFFTQTIVDNVLVNENKKLLFGILSGMVLVFIAQVMLYYTRNILLLQFKVEFELTFFSRFFEHFISLKQQYYDKNKREDFINRFNEKIKLRSLASPHWIQNFIDLFFIIGYLPILLFYNLQLGFLAIIFSFSYLFTTVYFTPLIRAQINKIFFKDTVVLGRFLDTLLGISSVKLLGIEKLKFWKWKNEYRRNLNLVLDSEKMKFKLIAIQKGIYFFSQLSIFWYGAYLAFSHTITIGQYLAFITIFMIIINSLNNIAALWLDLMDVFVATNRINDILIQESESNDVLGKDQIQNIDQIEIRDLSFKYYEKDKNYILKQVNLKITSKQFVGIVGRNGTGKTTLAKLLVNLYTNYQGRILLNEKDIKSINLRNLRSKIFLFPQDIYIFDGSIKENILYANPSATIDQVIEAAKKVGLHDFIKGRYLGYNHVIGEFGANLSGGQKLKIGFARLLISNPDVIILDEASSSLDLETEKNIMTEVRSHFKDKIIISIAHRLHTLKESDKIIVIDDGKIIEEGRHSELIEKEGLYHQFLSSYVNF